MDIRLTNSKTRRKEAFAPIDADNVRMYVCGPTVYDRAHLGNARPVIVFDVLYRLLRYRYGPEHVTYVRNFTDVDDKINARAAESGRSIGEITAETTQWFLDDMAEVGALEPDHMPRATQYIDQMVAMIEGLIARGYAYAAEGHVLFAVESYAEYGALSGRSVDDMIAGARVEVAPYKRNPMDFVLWKPSSEDLPGWDSPWGRGRPGWHIECSAMADELLWKQPLAAGRLSQAAQDMRHVFDIHGGGNDLQFPHHENEIAQSCCANGTERMANVWLHNEMLQVEGRKMSKSLGNFFTVRDLLDQGVPGEVIRFVMLSTHYRKPMDWTEKKREEAEKTLRKWRDLFKPGSPKAISSEVPETILACLADDLNTAGAISELHHLANEGKVAQLSRGANLLGLLTDELGAWYKEPALPKNLRNRINNLLKARADAKKARNFERADKIRDGLNKLGISITDTPEGSDWSFDHVQAAMPIHHKLIQLLEAGDHTAFEEFRSGLMEDGFKITLIDTDIPASERLHFRVGRSEKERARVLKTVSKEMKMLEVEE